MARTDRINTTSGAVDYGDSGNWPFGAWEHDDFAKRFFHPEDIEDVEDFSFPATPPGVYVAADADDADFVPAFSVYQDDYETLFMADSGGYAGGIVLRWVLDVPQGATITSAYVVFAAAVSVGSLTVTIKGEDADDATAITSYANLASRSRTTAEVDWEDLDFTDLAVVQTPPITNVVQEVVDRVGWVSGNYFRLFFEDAVNDGYDAYAAVFAREQHPGLSGRLVVEYET